jgi:prevent-host-death family protein
MENEFSIYDAKARFSELVRRARNNQRVIVTSHGRPVVEIVPYQPKVATVADLVAEAEASGVLEVAREASGDFRSISRRPGALSRFLEERE